MPVSVLRSETASVNGTFEDNNTLQGVRRGRERTRNVDPSRRGGWREPCLPAAAEVTPENKLLSKVQRCTVRQRSASTDREKTAQRIMGDTSLSPDWPESRTEEKNRKDGFSVLKNKGGYLQTLCLLSSQVSWPTTPQQLPRVTSVKCQVSRFKSLRRSVIDNLVRSASPLVKELEPLDEEKAEPLISGVWLINKNATDTSSRWIPFGMEMRSFKDGSKVTHHVVYSFLQSEEGLSIAQELQLEINDELLMLDQTRLIGHDHWEALRAFRNLALGGKFTLYTRRLVNDDEGQKYVFRKVSGRVRLYTVGTETVTIVTSELLGSSSKPGRAGLYMIQRKQIHEVYVAAADNATYLRNDQGHLVLSGGLTNNRNNVFICHWYAGFGRLGNPETFFILNTSSDNPQNIWAKNKTTLALKKCETDGISAIKNPDPDVCYKVDRKGQMYCFESYKYRGHFMCNAHPDLTLDRGNPANDGKLRFFIRHAQGTCFCRTLGNRSAPPPDDVTVSRQAAMHKEPSLCADDVIEPFLKHVTDEEDNLANKQPAPGLAGRPAIAGLLREASMKRMKRVMSLYGACEDQSSY